MTSIKDSYDAWKKSQDRREEERRVEEKREQNLPPTSRSFANFIKAKEKLAKQKMAFDQQNEKLTEEENKASEERTSTRRSLMFSSKESKTLEDFLSSKQDKSLQTIKEKLQQEEENEHFFENSENQTKKSTFSPPSDSPFLSSKKNQELERHLELNDTEIQDLKEAIQDQLKNETPLLTSPFSQNLKQVLQTLEQKPMPDQALKEQTTSATIQNNQPSFKETSGSQHQMASSPLQAFTRRPSEQTSSSMLKSKNTALPESLSDSPRSTEKSTPPPSINSTTHDQNVETKPQEKRDMQNKDPNLNLHVDLDKDSGKTNKEAHSQEKMPVVQPSKEETLSPVEMKETLPASLTPQSLTPSHMLSEQQTQHDQQSQLKSQSKRAAETASLEGLKLSSTEFKSPSDSTNDSSATTSSKKTKDSASRRSAMEEAADGSTGIIKPFLPIDPSLALSSDKKEAPTENLKEILQQLVEQIVVIRADKQTDTLITLRSPKIFEDATIRITTYDQAKGEINLTFGNLTPQAKQLLDQHLKQSLVEHLSQSQIIVHNVFTTTQSDVPKFLKEKKFKKKQD